MYGIHTYEELSNNPYLQIINWEYIAFHPEAKFAIRERYQTDPVFKMKIDEKKRTCPIFKQKFEEQFPSLNKSR